MNVLENTGGRVPPHDVSLEKQVLGSFFYEKDSLYQISEILKPEHFYKEEHSVLYSVILDLHLNAKPIDAIFVTSELRTRGLLEQVGGAHGVMAIAGYISYGKSMMSHVLKIKEFYMSRIMITSTAKMHLMTWQAESDPFQVAGSIQAELDSVLDSALYTKEISTSQLIGMAIMAADKARENEGRLTGVPSGFVELDKITNGFQETDFVVLAARPGMGKTSLALNIASNASLAGYKVGFFSLEMSNIQLGYRYLAIRSNIHLARISRGTMSDSDYEKISNTSFDDDNVYFDDTPSVKVIELRAKLWKMVKKNGIKLAIIDYLQLMDGTVEGKGQNREQEISFISRSLKAMAKDMKICIIALAQLSREVEKRPDKKPMLSDLRESGAIEQDADIVMFLYWFAYYLRGEDITNDFTDVKGVRVNAENYAQILIRKHRNGSTGDVPIYFEPEMTSYRNITEIPADADSYNAKIEPDEQWYHKM